MGAIGGLFTAKAPENYIEDSDLAKRGFNTVNANSAVQGGLNQTLNTQTNANTAQGMGLGAAGQGFEQSNQANAGQSALAQQLALRAAGKAGPSIAEQQLSHSLGQVQQQGAGSMAAARGVSPGTAARLISQNQTNAAQTAAGQGAILRSQEQQAAENQLGNVLAQQRQGALGQAQTGLGGFGTGAQAGTAALGTAGAINQGQNQIASQLSQANLSSKNSADQANAKAANDLGSSMMSSIGGAMALSGGGEVPGPSLAEHLLASHRHLSSAHEHISRYAAGGEVPDERTPSGSYKFDAMDVRPKPSSKAQYVPHNRLDVSGTSDQTAATKEGQDSEGNEKKLHLADGGDVPYETNFEAQQRMRDEQRERNKEKDTGVAMHDLERQSEANGEASGATKPEPTEVAHMAGGGLAGLIGGGIHALGQALGIGQNDAVKAGNTEGGTEYEMNTDPTKGGTAVNLHDDTQSIGGGSDESTGLELGPKMGSLDAAPSMGMAARGGSVPGHARVPGNSLKNDTVPTMLSPGEVVLPRTVSHDPDAAAEFVQHINARRKMAEGGEVGPKYANGGYGRVLAKQRELHNRLAALEARLDGRK